MSLQYFKPHELWDRETKVVLLAPGNKDGYIGFGKRIDALREEWGKPLAVNSCCRSAARNARVGGHPRSLHVYDKPFHPTGGTAAIDFSETSEEFRLLAWSLGFSLGINRSFTHCDDRYPLLGMPQAEFRY